VLLDVGVTADQTLGRRAVNLLRPEARGRLNGLFAACSLSAARLARQRRGWPGARAAVCGLGAAFAHLALASGWRGWHD
jgi:hypothetical protein